MSALVAGTAIRLARYARQVDVEIAGGASLDEALCATSGRPIAELREEYARGRAVLSTHRIVTRDHGVFYPHEAATRETVEVDSYYLRRYGTTRLYCSHELVALSGRVQS